MLLLCISSAIIYWLFLLLVQVTKTNWATFLHGGIFDVVLYVPGFGVNF